MPSQYGQFIILAMSIYCIFSGARTLLTGKAGAGEEARIAQFTEKAAKKYRKVSAFLNIFAGLILAVMSIIKLVNPDVNRYVYGGVCLGIIVVFLTIYAVTWQQCKKDQ